MRVIYFGSGEFGLPSLQWLDQHHELVAVVTQPDRPAGRKRQLTPTPVASWAAEQAGLDVIKQEDVNGSAFVEHAASLRPELGVVIAFGQKLSEPLVAASGQLAVNLHASLLPKYRGAAPINWAIIEGETRTGLSVISLAQTMDAGLIYAQVATDIDPAETAGELHDRLAQLGPEALKQTIAGLQSGQLQPQEQDPAQVTKAPKLRKDMHLLSFREEPDRVRRVIHGLTPWPGVGVDWHRRDGGIQPLNLRRVAIAEPPQEPAEPGTVLEGARVACGSGAIQLREVQLPGKSTLPIERFVTGHPLHPGEKLVPPEPANEPTS